MPGQGIKPRNLTLRSHLGADRHPTLSLSQFWFALFRGDPSNTGVEPDGTGAYTRISKTNDATLWGTIAATDVLASNKGSAGEIAWPVVTGVYSITSALDWWAIFDLSAGGTLWYWGQLSQTITVTTAGDQPRIPVSTLVINQLA